MTRWLIWAFIVVGWTLMLEFPGTDPGGLPGGEVILSNKIIVAKVTHVAVYALLTVLSAWVPMAGRYRWLMMLFLTTHAWGTEMLQQVLSEWCHRTGNLADVGFDILGILVGIAASWKWWTRQAA